MRLDPGKRLKGVRELIGFTAAEFAKVTGIEFNRLRNVEQGRARVCGEEYEAIGLVLPEIIPWLTYEGEISLKELKKSSHPLCRMITANIEVGRIPPDYFFEDKIK